MVALLGAASALAAVDSGPKFDVGPSCRASAKRAVPVGDPSVCLDQERSAREQLRRGWRTFMRDDKNECVPLATLGGSPTYTELLTCLELSREARNLHDRTALSTSR